MSKKLRDRRIDTRVAAPLYEVLEQEAVAKGMPNMSAHVRSILIKHAERRIIETQENAA